VWSRDDAIDIEGIGFLIERPRRESTYQWLPQSFFDELKEFIARHIGTDHAKNETRDTLANALQLYAEAMDAGYEYLHFLSLWQLAEAVTLVRDQGGVSDKVCVRVAQIIKRVAPELDSNGMRKVLKSFADSRHRIVHEGGDAEVSQDDCGFLRRICEAAIYWLIHNQATLPTVEHLRHFYGSNIYVTST
jgi:hypothetical protein